MAKIVRPKYDFVSGQFLGLVEETQGYLTVCCDEHVSSTMGIARRTVKFFIVCTK